MTSSSSSLKSILCADFQIPETVDAAPSRHRRRLERPAPPSVECQVWMGPQAHDPPEAAMMTKQ